MSLAAQHVESLARFADLDPTGWGLRRALDLALRPATEDDLALAVAAPQWVGDQGDRGDRWVSEVTLRLTGQGGTASGPLVPWLVDDRAIRSATPGAVVGGHDGTYVDRPRLPVAALVRTPGVRLLARRSGGGLAVELELQPRFGAAWRVAVTGGELRARCDLPPLAGDASEHTSDHAPLSDEAGLASRITARGFHLDAPTLAESVAIVTGMPRESAEETLTETDVAALLDALRRATDLVRADPDARPAGVVGELDPAARHLSFYGDQLLAETYRAARAAVRDAAAKHGAGVAPEVVVALVRQRLAAAWSAVATGGTSSAAVERLGNTVALAEAGRQVSLIGPDGLPPLRGRLDLRTLDEAWRTTLCPVHTPESTKVGLVRHVALGGYPLAPMGAAAGPYPDVSVAAALVPFLNHDDPTRASIVTKMFGQALQVEGAHPPAVRTGMETALAEAAGVVRAERAGVVKHTGHGVLRLGDDVVGFGPAGTARRDQDPAWHLLVADTPEGTYVVNGTALAHAPDVAVEPDGTACLRLGLDALTAFLPWHGWNYEDGIVVSSAFAERAASHHLRTVTAPLPAGADVMETVPADQRGGVLPAGTTLAVVLPLGVAAGVPVTADEDCTLVLGGDQGRAYTQVDDKRLSIGVRVRRPLQVGDKLTTRHGGKGVVTRIEPVEAMPRLPDGTPIEVLLNPLGVLRRLNIGTYLEAATALERRLAGRTEPVVVPRRHGPDGLATLADSLSRLGAKGGRLPLLAADGSPVGPEGGVVVGDLHLLKLVHRAEAKAGGRKDAGPSPVSLQPSRSRSGRRGTPQRLGEMELWALQAVGARETVLDLLRARGTGRSELRGLPIVPAGLRAAVAHLAVAGIQVTATTADAPVKLWQRPDLAAEAISAVTVGTGPSGLQDLFKLAKTGPGARPTSQRAAARALLAAADDQEPAGLPGLSAEAAAALAEETVRFTIPLDRPVPHPWMLGAKEPKPTLADINEVPVLPPAFFPPEEFAGPDPLRRRYLDLLTSTITLQRALSAAANARPTGAKEATAKADEAVEGATADVAAKVRWLLGRLGDGPVQGTIAGRLSGKYGILRRNLLGTSAIRSGRAVLVGDPTLGVEQVGLPAWLLADLGVPRSPMGHADVVVLNRQPTLHPYNLVALRAVASPHDAVTVHPYLLQAIAGDFDGDTAAVHRPAGEAARAEIWELCRPGATLHNARDGSPLAKRDLDVAVGLHVLESAGKLEPLAGRALPDGPDVAARVTALVQGELDEGGPVEERLERVAEVMRAGWAGAQHWGFSVVDLPRLSPDEGEEPAEAVKQALAAATSAPLLSLRQAFEAGAAGGLTDLAQLLVTRGDVRPTTALPAPDATTWVPECYLEGLGDEGYFAAAQPAVAGLAAKKLVTPHAGGLTKRLVELGYHEVLGSADCGWAAQDGGPAERSALTCLDQEICCACYDPTGVTRLQPRPGARVGVLAGMLIGERSTQLAMKSIHQRGAGANLKGDVDQLERLFARGTLIDTDGVPQPWTPEAAVARFAALLPAVELPHAHVLLRAAESRRRPGALVRAAQRGDLGPLVRAVRPGRDPAPETVAGDHLLRLILGAPA